MNPSSVRELATRVGRHWSEMKRLAGECLGFMQVLQKLPQFIELNGWRAEGFTMRCIVDNNLKNATRYGMAARRQVIKEIQRGAEACSSYLSKAPHPNVLLACAFFARAMQLCQSQQDCSRANECALLKFANQVSLET